MTKVLTETKTEQNLIALEILPFINTYKKKSATTEDVNSLAKEVSYVLDLWEYTAKEISSLDRKAFFDIMKAYFSYLKNSNSKELFMRVFDF